MKKIITQDKNLIRLQDNVADSVEVLEKNPFLKGIIVAGVQVTTSFADVAHKLGRVPLGYVVVSASDIVALAQGTAKTPDKFLNLKGSVASTVTLYIF